MNLVSHPVTSVTGVLSVPGDKSISHRAIMLGSIAEGVTHISGFLEGQDSLATLQAFKSMRVNIRRDGGKVIIHGAGLRGLKSPQGEIYLGNSGTSMRLLSGLLAGQRFSSCLTGDDSLEQRPMMRVVEPLRAMGADITPSEDGCAPLSINGQILSGIDYKLPVASAQVKSALLLAGVYAGGMTCVTEPLPSRDHTERMLLGFGYKVGITGNRICLRGGGKLTACDINIPADISSAAFFLVAASIAQNADLSLTAVGINPTRTGVIDILRLMGANIRVINKREEGGEPVADIRVKSASLKGIKIPEELVPLAIDEFPVLMIAAACARGATVLSKARELRVKETDRIAAMAEGLSRLGVKVTATDDGMTVIGQDRLSGAEVASYGDHRIAMAFAISAVRADSPISILDCDNITTSFPGFVRLSASAGFDIRCPVRPFCHGQ